MSVTLKDICRKTGVSTATVSRVINDSSLVTGPTRERVMDAIRELKYRPSHAARALARQRSDMLGVIFPQIHSGFFSQVLRGIDEVAAKDGFHLMTAFSHNVVDEKKLITHFVHERRVDALILLNILLPDRFVKSMVEVGMPLVLIDRPVKGENLFSVSIDNLGGVEQGMEHLLEHGYRHIAILCGPKGTYDADQRLKGCKKTLSKAGVTLPQEMFWAGGFTEESGQVAMSKWLDAGHTLPEAIFALNDAMALGAMHVLREAGYRVPDQVAFMGFDDNETARHVGLTSIQVPIQELGQMGGTYSD
ncbi:MAG: substrate-binding domain-containing protein [Kiritimatiellae bacterium]|nr:substrate-binding domain-containing protein [Kiritimatiellia bacterium]